jgi:hypothetical protein
MYFLEASVQDVSGGVGISSSGLQDNRVTEQRRKSKKLNVFMV